MRAPFCRRAVLFVNHFFFPHLSQSEKQSKVAVGGSTFTGGDNRSSRVKISAKQQSTFDLGKCRAIQTSGHLFTSLQCGACELLPPPAFRDWNTPNYVHPGYWQYIFWKIAFKQRNHTWCKCLLAFMIYCTCITLTVEAIVVVCNTHHCLAKSVSSRCWKIYDIDA